MMHSIISLVKTIATAIAIILVLKFTGLLGSVAYYSQSAVMATGILDADDVVTKEKKLFPYQFSVKNLSGIARPVESFKGKVIFLNLWATWCGPCKAEMPAIEKLYQSIDTTKVAFIMLSIDRERDKQKILNYISEKKFTFPVYQPASELPELLRVPSIPTTFIISKEGQVVSQEVGTTNFNTPRFKKFLSGLAEGSN